MKYLYQAIFPMVFLTAPAFSTDLVYMNANKRQFYDQVTQTYVRYGYILKSTVDGILNKETSPEHYVIDLFNKLDVQISKCEIIEEDKNQLTTQECRIGSSSNDAIILVMMQTGVSIGASLKGIQYNIDTYCATRDRFGVTISYSTRIPDMEDGDETLNPTPPPDADQIQTIPLSRVEIKAPCSSR